MPYSEKDYDYALSVTSQFFFCGLPFRLDTTPKCSLNCLYCYAMSLGGRNTKPAQIANPEKLKRRFESLEYKHNPSITDKFLIEKMPLHFGGMSDPFADSHTTEVTLNLLKILSTYNYPVVLSTKNTDILIDEQIINILKTNKNLIIQISFSTPNKYLSSIIEPNSPSPNSRIEAISKLSSINIPVFSRIQPFLPWRMKEICSELIPRLSEAKSSHITIEFLKLPIEKRNNPISELNEACEMDIFQYYQQHDVMNVSREWQIPPKIKWELLQPVIETLHKYNLSYGSGDYGLNHLGDTDCCCGVDKVEGFSHFFKGNFAYFFRKSTNDILYWRNFSTYKFPDNSIKRYIMSNSRLPNVKNNIFEFLKNKWNRPGTINSPDSFLGVKFTGEYDKEGFCIYEKSEC